MATTPGPAFALGGELVRGYRERTGLSQEDLAEAAGVSDRTVRNVELGLRRPRRATLDQLIGALRLTDVERDALEAAWRGNRRPCSLPGDIPDFVGRAGLVTDLLVGGAAPDVALVCVVAGMGGVGKTTLAVHAAHRAADRFPGGQLYLDLRGTGGNPVDAGEALGRLLDRLGVPAAHLPRELGARAELLRDRLSDRRYLLVLDDAANEAQVRPLLPGTASSAVLITSRNRLPGLAGARLVELDSLAEAEALTLLANVAGAPRIAAEEAAARSVARLCGRLPLAVRIVAALLAGRPGWRVAHLADLLADERDRLAVLEAGDLDVASSISLSYRTLPAPARRAFRLLGALDAPDLPAWAAAATLEVSLTTAGRLLERLVDAYLLESPGTDQAGQVRYRFHDLIRIYARHHDPDPAVPVDVPALVERAGRAWLTLAERASAAAVPPSPGTRPRTTDRWAADERVIRSVLAAPVDWLDAERAAIVATVRQAI
jgi:DNA-binding XRE family transcriptional regulator